MSTAGRTYVRVRYTPPAGDHAYAGPADHSAGMLTAGDRPRFGDLHCEDMRSAWELGSSPDLSKGRPA